jgi:hypothetical protein
LASVQLISLSASGCATAGAETIAKDSEASDRETRKHVRFDIMRLAL